MAITVGVVGESGSGKSTSLRNLDPKSTFIIDADKKGLTWRGWRKQFNAAAENYYVGDNAADVLGVMRYVNDERPDIHVLIVDTINGVMVADEASRRTEKGYDKWIDLAWSVYDLIDEALVMRDDLVVVFTAHAQTDVDENGNRFTHIKTSGRKLDKIVLESKFNYVFLAKRVNGEYVFITSSDDSTAKGGYGLFDDVVPNDLSSVLVRIIDFEYGDDPNESE